MQNTIPKPLRLNVILNREDNVWVARCAELDTLAADPDLETAWCDCVKICRAHIAYGLSIGRTLQEMVRPAPADAAAIIAQAEIDGFIRLHFNRVDAGHTTDESTGIKISRFLQPA